MRTSTTQFAHPGTWEVRFRYNRTRISEFAPRRKEKGSRLRKPRGAFVPGGRWPGPCRGILAHRIVRNDPGAALGGNGIELSQLSLLLHLPSRERELGPEGRGAGTVS